MQEKKHSRLNSCCQLESVLCCDRGIDAQMYSDDTTLPITNDGFGDVNTRANERDHSSDNRIYDRTAQGVFSDRDQEANTHCGIESVECNRQRNDSPSSMPKYQR